MASGDRGAHAGWVHSGPSTHKPRTTLCCGGRPQVVSLTRAERHVAVVELVRCVGCGRSTWRLGGVEVEKAEALAALAAAFVPPGQADTRRPVRRSAEPATRRRATPAAPAVDLADLLSGWQVLGAG
ncbi:MAG: hypothetical protein QOJ79_864 [Actinomycetota bacterium]|jgi:hypothetical protein|nr:hypothetical protein [Actinomycetota bacterium]